MSDSLRPHEPQHDRPPCPSPTPRIYPNPWVYILIQNTFTNQFKGKVPKFSLYIPISMMNCIFCKMSSRFFLQWKFCLHSPLGWTGWISLQSKGLSRVFSNTTVQLSHPYMTTGTNPVIKSVHSIELWKLIRFGSSFQHVKHLFLYCQVQ